MPPLHHDFATCRNPEAYIVDWRSYYEEALLGGAALRLEFPHAVEQYGPHQQQVVNVLHPPHAVAAPAVVFFHGGRWREGHPDYYDMLARPWLDRGCVFVSAGYRLEPGVTKRAAVEDAAAALHWASANIAKFGGSPERISVAGHSAGGHLAAVLAATALGRELLDVPLVAAIGVSGVYDIVADEAGAEGVALSPALNVADADAHSPEIVLAYGTPEANAIGAPESFFSDQAWGFGPQLRAHGYSIIEVPLPDHDHIQTAKAFGDDQNDLFRIASSMVIGPHEGALR